VIKKLTAIGSSLGIIIEQPILELLDIDQDTPLKVRTDAESLIIRAIAWLVQAQQFARLLETKVSGIIPNQDRPRCGG
jgi:hypothetical protein